METTTKERVKPIRVTDEETGREYILDFSRETIKMAEARGFTWDLATDMPFTYLPIIWHYAFVRYEPRISPKKTQELFDIAGGIQPKQLARLKELYEQCGESLVAEETEDGNTKNSKISVVLE